MDISVVDLRLGCRLKRDAVLFVELDAVVPLWGFEQHYAECSAMHDAIATISGGKLQCIEVVPPDHIVAHVERSKRLKSVPLNEPRSAQNTRLVMTAAATN